MTYDHHGHSQPRGIDPIPDARQEYLRENPWYFAALDDLHFSNDPVFQHMQSIVQQENFYNNDPEMQKRLFTEEIAKYAEMQLKNGDGIIHNILTISNRALHIHREDLFRRAEAPEVSTKMQRLRRELRELIERQRPEREIRRAEEKVKESETALRHLREDVHLLGSELRRRDPRRYNPPTLVQTMPIDQTPPAPQNAPEHDDVVKRNAIRSSLNAEVKDYLSRALQVYRSKKCTLGQITSGDDFNYVVKKCSTKITGKILNELKENSLSKKGRSLATKHCREYLHKYGAKFDRTNTKIHGPSSQRPGSVDSDDNDSIPEQMNDLKNHSSVPNDPRVRPKPRDEQAKERPVKKLIDYSLQANKENENERAPHHESDSTEIGRKVLNNDLVNNDLVPNQQSGWIEEPSSCWNDQRRPHSPQNSWNDVEMPQGNMDNQRSEWSPEPSSGWGDYERRGDSREKRVCPLLADRNQKNQRRSEWSPEPSSGWNDHERREEPREKRVSPLLGENRNQRRSPENRRSVDHHRASNKRKTPERHRSSERGNSPSATSRERTKSSKERTHRRSPPASRRRSPPTERQKSPSRSSRLTQRVSPTRLRKDDAPREARNQDRSRTPSLPIPEKNTSSPSLMPNRRQQVAALKRAREEAAKQKEELAKQRAMLNRQKEELAQYKARDRRETNISSAPMGHVTGQAHDPLHNRLPENPRKKEEQPRKEESKPVSNAVEQVSDIPETGEAIMIISDDDDEELSPQEIAKQKASEIRRKLEAKAEAKRRKKEEKAEQSKNLRDSIASKLDKRQQKAFKSAEESHEKASTEKGTIFYEKKQELQTRIDAGLINAGITTQKERDEILRKAKAAKEIESYQQSKKTQKTAAQQRMEEKVSRAKKAAAMGLNLLSEAGKTGKPLFNPKLRMDMEKALGGGSGPVDNESEKVSEKQRRHDLLRKDESREPANKKRQRSRSRSRERRRRRSNSRSRSRSRSLSRRRRRRSRSRSRDRHYRSRRYSTRSRRRSRSRSRRRSRSRSRRRDRAPRSKSRSKSIRRERSKSKKRSSKEKSKDTDQSQVNLRRSFTESDKTQEQEKDTTLEDELESISSNESIVYSPEEPKPPQQNTFMSVPPPGYSAPPPVPPGPPVPPSPLILPFMPQFLPPAHAPPAFVPPPSFTAQPFATEDPYAFMNKLPPPELPPTTSTASFAPKPSSEPVRNELTENARVQAEAFASDSGAQVKEPVGEIVTDRDFFHSRVKRMRMPDKIVLIIRGLPGSGKTFVANEIEKLEKEHGKKVKRFDMEDEFKESKHDVPDFEDYGRAEHRENFFKKFKKEVQKCKYNIFLLEDVFAYISDFESFYEQSLQFGEFCKPFVIDVGKTSEDAVEELFLNQNFKRSLEMVQGFQQNYQKTPERFNRVILRYCFGVENDHESGECTTETESQENITSDGDVTDLSRARLSFSIGPAVATPPSQNSNLAKPSDPPVAALTTSQPIPTLTPTRRKEREYSYEKYGNL